MLAEPHTVPLQDFLRAVVEHLSMIGSGRAPRFAVGTPRGIQQHDFRPVRPHLFQAPARSIDPPRDSLGGLRNRADLSWSSPSCAHYARQPSTKIELVSIDDPPKDFQLTGGTLSLRERNGPAVWENLRMKVDDLAAAIKQLKGYGQ